MVCQVFFRALALGILQVAKHYSPAPLGPGALGEQWVRAGWGPLLCQRETESGASLQHDIQGSQAACWVKHITALPMSSL